MPKIKTLNKLSELEESRFGRPHPRHGLKLLYWFANDCISFDQNSVIPECDPENEDFGFHLFRNTYDRNRGRLLPKVNITYYVVGNLNSPGADELPDYVREDHTGRMDDSNMDRIIVGLDYEMFDKVYVTEHEDQTHYNPDATYRISKGLLETIRSLALESFLRQAGYYGYSDYSYHDTEPIDTNDTSHCIQIDSSSDSESDVNEGTTTTRYSTRYLPRTQRKTCCECIIL